MIIYDKNGKQIINTEVDDASYRYRAICQTKKVELIYSLTEHIELPLGSYIDLQGERYTLWYPEDFEKKGVRNLEYKVTLGGNEEILKKYKYKQLSSKPYKLKFPLTATPRIFIQLMVDNLNLYDNGWSVGSCIESTEKLVSFNHDNCWAALGRLTQEFDTEFEVVGKTINFGKVEYFKDAPVTLSYGKGNGFLPGVGRSNQGDNLPVEILYVQGGDQNIDYGVYGSQTLLLPRSQELEYEGYKYKTDADGMYITRADKMRVSNNEDSYDASHVYPSRIGAISNIDIETGKDTAGNEVTFYNFYDQSIPADLNFEDCLIAGQTMTVIFQSGRLAGREFDVKYIHNSRKFEIISTEQDGMMLPNASLYPSIEDKYAVFNISLPPTYICDNTSKTGASWDMFREAVRYFREHEEQQFAFKGKLDGIWAKKNWPAIGLKLLPGGYVDFSDNQFQPQGVLIRIIGVKDFINKLHSPELELSNATTGGFLQDDLGKLEAEEVKNDKQHKDALRFTIRRWMDAISMQNMLEKAFKDYGKGQNVSWLRTMSVLVGHEALQFRFVDRIPTQANLTVNELDHSFIYNNNTKIFSCPSGIIQHMTLGIDSLSPAHKATEYKFWKIAAYEIPLLNNTEPMYLYAKCSKTDTTASFLLSKEPIEMDGYDGFYYLLTGALSGEIDGLRSFASLYGFSEIGPGWMRLNKIISTDGTQYWDMLSKAFKIGDDNSYLSFEQHQGVRLKGVFYQSPSGAIDYPEVDRGNFANDTIYYPGDKVAYAGNVYKCVTQTTGKQHPNDPNYWKLLVSKGDKGDQGIPGDKGETGEMGYPGNPGPSPIYRGEYSSSVKYTGTSKRVDIVYYPATGKYYVARLDNGESVDFYGKSPTNTNYWSEFGGQFSSIATGLLLASWANIAGFIFNDEKLYSQDVNQWTGDANLMLNGRTGEIIAKRGKFLGSIGTPFIWTSQSGTLDLSRNFNLAYQNVMDPLYVRLPVDATYNGTICQIYNAPIITKLGSYVNVSLSNGGGIVNTAVLAMDYKTSINVMSGKIARFYAIINSSGTAVDWYLDNPKELGI